MPGAQRTVGRYEVVREVGRGGMAVVWLARQPDLDRDIALKELASFHALDPSFAERFAREARVGGALAHPSIVTVFEAFEDGGVPYIAMEYLPRGSLRPLVGRLSLPQVAGVLEGLLAGLDHASARGIVHRDLKPENVLITAEGRVKIADFGIAKAYNRVWTAHFHTATGMALGTPTYMAPEQAMGREVSVRTDLYAVGVIAYELLSGRPPFHDVDEPMAILLRHVSEPVPPLVDAAPGVDPRLAAWVQRLLAKDAAERPAAAQAAWEELEEIVVALLGPLWRRDARLVGAGGASESRPLTPAPFEDSSGYETFGEAEPAPPPVTTAREPAPAEPVPASPAAPAPPAATADVPPPAPASVAGDQGAPPPGAHRRRPALLAVGAVAVAAVAVGVAAVSGAFGGGGATSGAAEATKGLPACFTKLVADAVELPKGVEVPVAGQRQAVGRTYTFLLESGAPIGAFSASVHGGPAPFYRALGTHDTRCHAVQPAIAGKPDAYPNFVDYDQVRATLAGGSYDVRLAKENGKLTALLSVPKRPTMQLDVTRSGRRLTVSGTLPNDAYGDVTLTYRARRPDGSTYSRPVTVTIDKGAFEVSSTLTAAERRLRSGRVTAVFPGDGNYARASVTRAIPAA